MSTRIDGYDTDIASDEEISKLTDWQLDRELSATQAELEKRKRIGLGGKVNLILSRHKGRIRAEIVRRKPDGIPS